MEKLNLNYTPEMEKAMQQNHGMNFSEYEMNVDKRMEVEKARQESYERSTKMIAELKRDVHRDM